jgi:MoxR-like ATPase
LADDARQEIISALEQFYLPETPSAWAEMGIKHTLKLLFEGGPGQGKTSLVLALCGHFRRSLYVLQLTQDMSDVKFSALLSAVPRGAFVLIEDVEQAYASRGMSRSSVLNILDGVLSPTGVVIVFTTNHIEQLAQDPAALRHGRVDVLVHFPRPTDTAGQFIDTKLTMLNEDLKTRVREQNVNNVASLEALWKMLHGKLGPSHADTVERWCLDLTRRNALLATAAAAAAAAAAGDG